MKVYITKCGSAIGVSGKFFLFLNNIHITHLTHLPHFQVSYFLKLKRTNKQKQTNKQKNNNKKQPRKEMVLFATYSKIDPKYLMGYLNRTNKL